MPRYTKLPPITGKQLVKLLKADGWEEQRRTRHGIGLAKNISGRMRVTVVKYTADPIPDGTLSDILGIQQTAISKHGLLDLANKYGI